MSVLPVFAAVLLALPAAPASHPAHVFPLACEPRVHYGHVHHDYPATDMFAPVGCRFVAPVDGVVDEVSRKDH